MITFIITCLVLNFIFSRILVYVLIDCCTTIVLNYPYVKDLINDKVYDLAVKIYSNEYKIHKSKVPHIPFVNIFFALSIYLYTLTLKNKIK